MTSPDSDLLLAALIEQFKAAKASGSDPEIEKATTEYPELADELRQLWATVEFLQELGHATTFQPPLDAPPEGKDSSEPLPGRLADTNCWKSSEEGEWALFTRRGKQRCTALSR